MYDLDTDDRFYFGISVCLSFSLPYARLHSSPCFVLSHTLAVVFTPCQVFDVWVGMEVVGRGKKHMYVR